MRLSENLSFSDDLKGNGSSIIHLNSLKIPNYDDPFKWRLTQRVKTSSLLDGWQT